MGRSAAPCADEPLLLTVPVPRSALTVVEAPPLLLTQRNVERWTGVPAETYLRMLRRPGGPRVIVEGKLRIVEQVEFVAWLKRQEAPPAEAGEPADGVTVLEAELGIVLRKKNAAKG